MPLLIARRAQESDAIKRDTSSLACSRVRVYCNSICGHNRARKTRVPSYVSRDASSPRKILPGIRLPAKILFGARSSRANVPLVRLTTTAQRRFNFTLVDYVRPLNSTFVCASRAANPRLKKKTHKNKNGTKIESKEI